MVTRQEQQDAYMQMTHAIQAETRATHMGNAIAAAAMTVAHLDAKKNASPFSRRTQSTKRNQ